MFIKVTDTNGIEFLANMSLVKFVWPVNEGCTLTAIDGTSIAIKESLDKMHVKATEWAFYDEREREQARVR